MLKFFNMPLYSVGWKHEDEEKLIDLIIPHPCLYNPLDPLKKNGVLREKTWADIATELDKPVDDCKKRWRSFRDTYMRYKRMGKESKYKCKADINRKLQFLDSYVIYYSDDCEDPISTDEVNDESQDDNQEGTSMAEQEVITDNQEYYEITVQDDQMEQKPMIKIISEPIATPETAPKHNGRKNCGRKRSMPLPRNLTPIKILPKPLALNGTRIMQYIAQPKVQPQVQDQRGQSIDKLVEKVLRENTNEIDVFFRSMAESVKKLQPSLIPKVKMEVCNVVAKYEMQNFERI